jgi:hypothetical protein
MPEQLRKQVLGGLPRIWLLGCAVSLATVPVLGAESVPESVRACAAITDSLQRLVCYDREVAKYPASVANAAEKSAPAAQQNGTAQVTAPRPESNAAPGASAAVAPAPATTAPAPTTTAPAAAATAPSDGPVSAHIVSIEHHPNQLVLHLDNGQVWEEVQSVWGDLSLRAGDVVTIDRHFGSFWLNGAHVSSMKVERKN